MLYAHAACPWSLFELLVDFKRTTKSLNADASSAFGRTGTGPVGHVPDTALHKFSMQQCMYALMLEQTVRVWGAKRRPTLHRTH